MTDVLIRGWDVPKGCDSCQLNKGGRGCPITGTQYEGDTWVMMDFDEHTERLPHYLDHVLCVNKYGIQMVGHLTDYKEGGFRCESGMDSCDYITHWMPLPKAPKEVE